MEKEKTMKIRFIVAFVLLAVASLPLSAAERAGNTSTPAACGAAGFTPAQAGPAAEEATLAEILPRPQPASTDSICCVPCRGGWICGTLIACCPTTLQCCKVP